MKTLSNHELQVRCDNLRLPQLDHLADCIKISGADLIGLIEPFDLWHGFVTAQSGQMMLYAQQHWKHIDELVGIVDQQISDWVYMAVNRYLVLCDPVENACEDWDQSLKDYFDQNLQNYIVIDYQFQSMNYTGTVGNFISPDNRFLCKKVK
jgi:hypothetical protein